MSIISETKVCPICGRKYSFNPDVGKMFCPHCGGPSENSIHGIVQTKPVKLSDDKPLRKKIK